MSKEFQTELYVWGNDEDGQLGLGHRYCKNGQPKVLLHPKTCSFNILIKEVACGEDFTFLLTSRGLLYAMGSNQHGKLGLSQSKAEVVTTPKLVDSLASHVIESVACGLNHSLAVTADSGLVYSWGCGAHG